MIIKNHANKNLTQLKGYIERVTFSNDQNSFCVCKLRVKNELITIVGDIVNPIPGEFVQILGKWNTHSKYGSQFLIEQYKNLVPASVKGIQKYLGSGLIKGIGPVMSKRIVKEFGENSLDIIENDIQQLAKKVERIGKKRIAMIQKAWTDQKQIRSVMLFLQSHDVSSAYAAKIFKHYGQNSIDIVQQNPYRLARDIFGIGFVTADTIAQKLGIKKNAPHRIEAGLEYVLHNLSNEGHACYPYEKLYEKVQEMLVVKKEFVVKAIKDSFEADRIVIETNDLGKNVFLKKYYVCETMITKNLERIINFPKNIIDINSQKALDWVGKNINIDLAENQKKAVAKALNEKILIITGGPGTGKTTIINAIIKIFKKIKAKILLAAPTGRAAKRMNEVTWENAVTIHRLLDYSIKQQGFKKNEKNPLKCDVLIIDEVSMIDLVLMHHLLKAIPSSATLILSGDINQLPCVGAGSVLSDMITSKVFCTITLDTIFRQAKKSLIVVNAHRINAGMFPIIANKKSNFYFISKEEPEDVTQSIIELVQKRIPNKFGFDPIDDIQILTPMHKGIAGALNLNKELQKILNKSTTCLKRMNKEFKVNDKVMQIRNNYDKQVYNGDIGRIIDINFVDEKVMLRFYNKDIEYDFSSLDEIVHAYAVSVHKSQGSEYPAVIIPVITQHYILLQRNLIYTAITRGKKLVVLVGTKKALTIAIRNDKASKRKSMLCPRLLDLV